MSTFPSRPALHRCHDQTENDAGTDTERTKSNRPTTNATLNRLTTPATSDKVLTQHRGNPVEQRTSPFSFKTISSRSKPFEPRHRQVADHRQRRGEQHHGHRLSGQRPH